MTEVTLSSKNQIVIPREAREALGLKPGDKLLIVTKEDRVIVIERPASFAAATRGMAGRAGRDEPIGHTAQFVITDAKVIDTKIAKTPGLRGVFTTDQSDRYDTSFAARIVVQPDPGNFGHAQATASATRAQTVPEGITVNEREKVWFDLVEATMNDLNAELDRQIRANLPKFLVESP